jgi:dihydroorotate dehydrogenase electron transfer subunit
MIATEDGSAGEKGMVTSLLQENMDWADQICACGPEPMYRTIVQNYRGIEKIKRMQVSLEVRMGCGLGFCYACTIHTSDGLKQVCKDGPVFELDQIVWEKL